MNPVTTRPVHKKPSSLTLKIQHDNDNQDDNDDDREFDTNDMSTTLLSSSHAPTLTPLNFVESFQRSQTKKLQVPKSFQSVKTFVALILAMLASLLVVSVVMTPPRRSNSFSSSTTTLYNNDDLGDVNETLPTCTSHQLLTGHWIQRQPSLKTITQLKQAYQYKPYKALTEQQHGILNTYETRLDGLYCTNEFSKIETLQMKQLDEQRILNVANWKWSSQDYQDKKCKIVEWNWRKVVKRLVSSRAGIIFLGDSITAQQYDSFALLLGNDPSSGPIIERVLSPPARRLDATRALFLDPFHPTTLEILNEIEKETNGELIIPKGRLNQPIVRTMRSDFLVTNQNVVELNLDKHGKTRIRSTEYIQELEQLATTSSTNEQQSWSSSIIVTSVGNWWERWIDSSESVSKSLSTYKQTMTLVFNELNRLTKQFDYTVVYRSVNRGTPHCEQYGKHFNSIDSNNNKVDSNNQDQHFGPIDKEDMRAKDQSSEHAWYLKQPMADIWRTLLSNVTLTTRQELELSLNKFNSSSSSSSLNLKPKKRKKRRRTRWINLDIEEMAYQRPEAHRFPPDDCLHWCLPSVLDDWNWATWHLINANEQDSL
ncbi:hypothetical protein OIO90_004851 [Microbotryomycetes sp. JL221]|nr:hypothetical protein OIO90_004851 [Microbotryomycetes sp. JL221]